MAGASRKGAGGRKATKAPVESAAMTAAATALLDSAPLFFSLDRARFYSPHSLTKVIVIQLPVSHLRSKEALHEYVLKKLLHRPYTLSAEERTELGLPALREVPPAAAVADDDSNAHLSTSPSTTTAGGKGKGKNKEEDPYVVVHITAIEPHADTVRQSNARGDIQMNAMVSFTMARAHHGMLCGRSEASPYENCVQVVVPREEHHHAKGKTKTTSKKAAGEGKREREEEGVAVDVEGGEADPEDDDTVIRMTVRCLAEEPVVSGQAVFVVSEPGGSIRCMAVRPPRAAPGPFRLIAAVDAEAERKINAKGRGGGGGGNTGRTPAPGAAEVLCDLPPKEETDGRPGSGKSQRREH